LAVETAIQRGATELVIIGGFGGRADHMLSNLAILEDLSARGVHAVMLNGQNRARFMRSTSTLIPRSGYKYVSLIAVDPVVKGVSIEGCKYPLKKAKLTRPFQYAVSNEIVGNCALISVRRGAVYIIESK
jgi:thiamine pyrophosphokinase